MTAVSEAGGSDAVKDTARPPGRPDPPGPPREPGAQGQSAEPDPLAPSTETTPPGPWLIRLDLGMRIAGFVVAVLLAAFSAGVEAFLAPLYWGRFRLPVALLLAVAGNLGLVWFTVRVTGRRLAVAGPALVWTALMIMASTRTTEGDLVLTGDNWVGIGTMLAGSLTFAVAGYRLILAGARPVRSGPAPPA
jgi:hypothetical protein